MDALLDTGSDITIAGSEVAKRCEWKIRPHPIKTVEIANGENMIIDGAAKIPLRIGERSMDSEVLISPDMNGFILGIDWLVKQGLVWDFPNQRIQFPDGEWMELRKEEERNRVCQIYVSEDTVLLPAQQTPVSVHITH